MNNPFPFKFNVNVRLDLYDQNGNLKESHLHHNAVTTAGIYGIMDQFLAYPSLSKPTHMELGTSTGGTTKLAAYISGSRVAFTSKTRTSNVVTIVADFGAGVATTTITEAGIFDSATQDAGNMWAYLSTLSITKGALDTLTVTWTFTGSAS